MLMYADNTIIFIVFVNSERELQKLLDNVSVDCAKMENRW